MQVHWFGWSLWRFGWDTYDSGTRSLDLGPFAVSLRPYSWEVFDIHTGAVTKRTRWEWTARLWAVLSGPRYDYCVLSE